MGEPPKMTAIDSILAQTALKLIPHSVRPNHLTIFRFCMIPVVFWVLWQGQYAVGLLAFAVTAFSDALDGALARTRNQCTEWGKLYDPLADKLLIITTGAVLMLRFLPPYVFIGVLGIDVLIIANAAYRKIFFDKIIPSHITGKVKMILQSVGTLGLFLHGMFGDTVSLELVTSIFLLAILFGLMSLMVYRKA